MSIADYIFSLFDTTPAFRYKGIPVNTFGMPVFRPFKKQSVRNSFRRLEQSGYLIKDGNRWILSEKGKKKHEKNRSRLPIFTASFDDAAPKNMFALFDVPETYRVYRNWLRNHLKSFGYILVQKSVWVGPSPLPKPFLVFLKERGLDAHVKFLKLARGYQF